MSSRWCWPGPSPTLVYALHYAHLFYTSDDGGKDLAGLIFPGDRSEPDYADFVYFCFTLGVALQTSDVAITSPRIRRVVIGHCDRRLRLQFGRIGARGERLGGALSGRLKRRMLDLAGPRGDQAAGDDQAGAEQG